MNPDNILQVLKIKKLEHNISNCKELTESDITFIKTLEKESLLELILYYDNSLKNLVEIFRDLTEQE